MSIGDRNAALVFVESRWAQGDTFNSGVSVLLSLDNVRWRPALERFAGRAVEGVMRGGGLSWSLSRGMGLSIG